MKKLNTKRTKQIKAGGGITGALFSGIGNVIKATFDGVKGIIDSTAGWVMGFKEAGKHHAKLNVKIGNSAISFDDTTKVKAAEHIATDQMKQDSKAETAPKVPKLVLEQLPETSDLEVSNNDYAHHTDDINQLMDNGMHIIDQFMHF